MILWSERGLSLYRERQGLRGPQMIPWAMGRLEWRAAAMQRLRSSELPDSTAETGRSTFAVSGQASIAGSGPLDQKVMHLVLLP